MFRLNLDIFDTSVLFFSWYIKPVLLTNNLYTYIHFVLLIIFVLFIKIIHNLYINILCPIIYILSLQKLTSLFSIFFGIKFILLIALLVFVRGGIPRYRYDFLTKLG